jgi:hypothetical protein
VIERAAAHRFDVGAVEHARDDRANAAVCDEEIV